VTASASPLQLDPNNNCPAPPTVVQTYMNDMFLSFGVRWGRRGTRRRGGVPQSLRTCFCFEGTERSSATVVVVVGVPCPVGAPLASRTCLLQRSLVQGVISGGAVSASAIGASTSQLSATQASFLYVCLGAGIEVAQ
jgi:hypothetical protein